MSEASSIQRLESPEKLSKFEEKLKNAGVLATRIIRNKLKEFQDEDTRDSEFYDEEIETIKLEKKKIEFERLLLKHKSNEEELKQILLDEHCKNKKSLFDLVK